MKTSSSSTPKCSTTSSRTPAGEDCKPNIVVEVDSTVSKPGSTIATTTATATASAVTQPEKHISSKSLLAKFIGGIKAKSSIQRNKKKEKRLKTNMFRRTPERRTILHRPPAALSSPVYDSTLGVASLKLRRVPSPVFDSTLSLGSTPVVANKHFFVVQEQQSDHHDRRLITFSPWAEGSKAAHYYRPPQQKRRSRAIRPLDMDNLPPIAFM